ncbi:hypothetical protein BT96DRAFT_262570 [Gymnopus androsaceus JB14]|uniref:F-box domain-containing protein n=1 Tax=Gymnopus androsaceus JB14 TaxID=1447944 RepID=A0A6A4H3W3_9AGAR|nr:hypothetical protein BT96DRAFT_262570 [Gymnopus androsaceus JB14]
MSLSNARAQFITLPNELLQLICSFVGVCFVFPGEKRDIYAVLAQTNSRLRSFALPCYFNKIDIPKFNVKARTKFVQDAGYIDAVRCLRLGSRDFARCARKRIYLCIDLPLIPRLRELICMDRAIDYVFLHCLAKHSKYQSRLQHISLCWCDDRLPDIQLWFPQLKTLCLALCAPVHLESPFSAPSLTALSICHHRLSPQSCASVNTCFPNLCILSLYHTGIEFMELCSIIETAPSLCEVTYRPRVPKQILLGHLIPVIVGESSFDIQDPAFQASHWPVNYTWRNVAFVNLAFVRKPVKSPTENSPKYSLISLSLERRDLGDERDDLMEILESFPCQTTIEELCIGIAICPNSDLTFDDYMLKVANSLRQWPCLRRFAFAGDLEGCCAFWALQPRDIPILDYITAPGADDEKLLTIEDAERFLQYIADNEYQDFVSEMLEILELPEDAVLDPSMELMPLWEVRHEVEVSAAVREMAKLCPTLEEFVWYIDRLESIEKQSSWHWKVRRKGDGSVDRVLGSLFWPDSCRPVFPPFGDYALVGEERKSAENHGWPKTAFRQS